MSSSSNIASVDTFALPGQKVTATFPDGTQASVTMPINIHNPRGTIYYHRYMGVPTWVLHPMKPVEPEEYEEVSFG